MGAMSEGLTGAPGPLDPAQEQQLTKQLGRALVKAATTGWQRLRAEYRSAGRHVEMDLLVTGADGSTRPTRPPMEVVELFGRLRSGLYRPEQGTWLAAVYLIESDGNYSVDYVADTEPRWRRVPPPIGFQDELRWFPRAAEQIPGWLRMRAGLPPIIPPAQAAAPTPPRGQAQQPNG